jgi:hypothetical protein
MTTLLPSANLKRAMHIAELKDELEIEIERLREIVERRGQSASIAWSRST